MTIVLKLSSLFQMVCRLYVSVMVLFIKFDLVLLFQFVFFVTHVPVYALVGEIKFIHSFIYLKQLTFRIWSPLNLSLNAADILVPWTQYTNVYFF